MKISSTTFWKMNLYVPDSLVWTERYTGRLLTLCPFVRLCLELGICSKWLPPLCVNFMYRSAGTVVFCDKRERAVSAPGRQPSVVPLLSSLSFQIRFWVQPGDSKDCGEKFSGPAGQSCWRPAVIAIVISFDFGDWGLDQCKVQFSYTDIRDTYIMC